MNDRERLIKILTVFVHNNAPIGHVTFGERFYKRVIENIADYLLENSVIVPPVKVGDMVWVIYDKCVMPANVLAVYVDKSGGMFDLKILTEGIKSVVNKDYTFDMVYLNRADAEKALKGGAIND